MWSMAITPFVEGRSAGAGPRRAVALLAAALLAVACGAPGSEEVTVKPGPNPSVAAVSVDASRTTATAATPAVRTLTFAVG